MQLRQVRNAIGRRLTNGCSVTRWLLPRLWLLLAVVVGEIRDPIAQTTNDNAQQDERLFIKGNDLLKKGDPETGLSFVRQAASKGFPKAQFQPGTAFGVWTSLPAQDTTIGPLSKRVKGLIRAARRELETLPRLRNAQARCPHQAPTRSHKQRPSGTSV